MKKISNKNMQQQLFQALFGTIAVKIPLNKAGTFAAPIRATAKVVESLLKFAKKRSFNLFIFASAISLNTLTISDALAKTGCFVESDNYVYCYNSSGVQQKLGDWSGGNSVYKVTSYTTDGDKLIVTITDRNVVELTYDTSANTVTNNYVSGSNKGITNTYTFAYNGNKTSHTHTNSDGSGYAYTYDPNTGRRTSYTQINSNGSGYAKTYDPNTGELTSYANTDSDGTVYAYTYDPNTGRETNKIGCSSDGKCEAIFYDCEENSCSRRDEIYGKGTIDLVTGKELLCTSPTNCYIIGGGFVQGKMTCEAGGTNCTTEQFDEKGKLIAEYDNDNQLIAKYDYDNSGNLVGTYDDQCVLQSCSSGHLEKNGSCIPAATGCGENYRQIENWCNRIRWTPAEAAAILNDDNNNSVTITFRK